MSQVGQDGILRPIVYRLICDDAKAREADCKSGERIITDANGGIAPMPPTRAVIALLFLGTAAQAPAQEYQISTYAGGSPPAGVNKSINVGNAITADASGNVYFVGQSDGSCVCIFKIDPNGVVTRIAGSSQGDFSGDTGPATSAQLGAPTGLAVDGAGNLFIADQGVFHAGSQGNDRIRRVSPDGIITTVAGGGALRGSTADGGPATSAQLYFPIGVAVDGAGKPVLFGGRRCRC
jgi:hypothetical protein